MQYLHQLSNYWFPLSFSNELPPGKLVAISLLNEPLVLYRDAKGVATCVLDRCPHRSTPLSLGRLVDGKLECLYHGWQFGACGACVYIPSELPNKNNGNHYDAIQKAVHEDFGLIWVWAGDKAEADINKIPRHLFDYYKRPGWETFGYFFDLDIPHELMIENLLDPAHVPFAHHGSISRRSKAEPLDMTITEKNANAIRGQVTCPLSPEKGSQQFLFEAPCIVRLDLNLTQKNKLIQLHFCIPVSPTKMRIIFYFFQNWLRFANKTSLTRWLYQKFNYRVIKQDIALLQGQYKNLQLGAKPWNRSVIADVMGLSYRKWFNQQIKSSLDEVS